MSGETCTEDDQLSQLVKAMEEGEPAPMSITYQGREFHVDSLPQRVVEWSQTPVETETLNDQWNSRVLMNREKVVAAWNGSNDFESDEKRMRLLASDRKQTVFATLIFFSFTRIEQLVMSGFVSAVLILAVVAAIGYLLGSTRFTWRLFSSVLQYRCVSVLRWYTLRTRAIVESKKAMDYIMVMVFLNVVMTFGLLKQAFILSDQVLAVVWLVLVTMDIAAVCSQLIGLAIMGKAMEEAMGEEGDYQASTEGLERNSTVLICSLFFSVSCLGTLLIQYGHFVINHFGFI